MGNGHEHWTRRDRKALYNCDTEKNDKINPTRKKGGG